MEKDKEFIFSKYVAPCANNIVFEELTSRKSGEVTESGIIIAKGKSHTPETDKPIDDSQLGVRIVAVGPEVTRVKVGDIVLIDVSGRYLVLEIFNGKYMFGADFNILAVLSEGASELHKEMSEEADKLKREVQEAKRDLWLTKHGPKSDKLDIN